MEPLDSQLIIDLNKATVTNGIYNCKTYRINHLKSFEILNTIVPYTFWNVRAVGSVSKFGNNIIYINDGTNPTWTVTIPGNVIYTKTTLAAALQAQLISTIAIGWTCSYDLSTDKFTIASPAANFSILTTQSIYNAKLLGLSSSSNLSGANTYSSTMNPVMQCTRYITVHSDRLSKYTKYSFSLMNSTNSDNILFAIMIAGVTFGDLVYYEPTVPFEFPFDPTGEQIDEFDLYFKDEYGFLVDFGSILAPQPVINMKLHLYDSNMINKIINSWNPHLRV